MSGNQYGPGPQGQQFGAAPLGQVANPSPEVINGYLQQYAGAVAGQRLSSGSTSSNIQPLYEPMMAGGRQSMSSDAGKKGGLKKTVSKLIPGGAHKDTTRVNNMQLADITRLAGLAQGFMGGGGAAGGDGGGDPMAGMMENMMNGPMKEKIANMIVYPVYAVTFFREVRLFVYWLHALELFFTLFAFLYVYPVFISSAPYQLVWMHIWHLPKSILGLMLLKYIPTYEEVQSLLMSAVSSIMRPEVSDHIPNTTPRDPSNDLKQFAKKQFKASLPVSITYLVLLVLAIGFDLITHIILMSMSLGSNYNSSIPAYAAIFAVSTIFFMGNAVVVVYICSVPYGLPKVVTDTVKKIINKGKEAAKSKKSKDKEKDVDADSDPEAGASTIAEE